MSLRLQSLIEAVPWPKKLQILQTIAGWDQTEAAERYGTTQKQVWAWNQGKCIPRRNSREAIARAHGLDVSDIFPLDMLKPAEIHKSA